MRSSQKNMKKIITLLIPCFLISCVLVPKKDFSDKRLRTEIETGKHYSSHITYRDNEKIMEERVIKEKNQHSRSIYFQGKLKFIETDENNDGFFETIMVLGDEMNLWEFEIFIRNKDGALKPLSSKKLEKMQQKMIDISKRFQEVSKKVMIEENARLKKENKPIPEWMKEQVKMLKNE